ncbi:MAG: VWA domain-containing protein, partial [Planctomycetota bacterium]
MNNPYFLLAFPLAAGALIAFFAFGKDRSRRADIRLFLRILTVALLTLALADFSADVIRRGRVVVFTVDESQSHHTHAQPAYESILSIASQLSENDRYATLRFGKHTFTERPLASPSVIFNFPGTSRSAGDATDIAAAIDRAVEVAESAGNAAIVVFTDGKATRGDAYAACVRARASGCRVHFRPPDAAPVDDVAVELLSAPQSAKVGEPVNARFRLTATRETAVTLRVFRGEEIILRRTVELQPDI